MDSIQRRRADAGSFYCLGGPLGTAETCSPKALSLVLPIASTHGSIEVVAAEKETT